ncbi:MAG: DNA alkylation repair protein [Anaerolineae bacterium]|nr:DNA alkylation repair protein [Anaerolineae bacterium]
MDTAAVLGQLESLGDPLVLAEAGRVGIVSKNILGVTMPDVRKLAKPIGKNHALAAELWQTGIFEARVVATLIDDPKQVTAAQMDAWARDFDNWALVDQTCGNLFDRTPFAYAKAVEWSARSEEFVKRAGFSLMAYLAVHDKKADNIQFVPFFAVLQREAVDERNYVKKAVNWALRGIGKRNMVLNQLAIQTAQDIQRMERPSARWIAADALRELRGEAVQARLLRK